MMFLSFHIGLSFVIAAVLCAVLERISGLDPPSKTTGPRYLKLLTVITMYLGQMQLDSGHPSPSS